MTITVNTPDGGTASFPDGTPTDTIASAMKAKFGGPDSNAMPDAERNPLGILSKFANAVGDTATFGLPDTIAGALGGKTQQMRSDTAADRADIGLPLSTVADAIGYGMGGGALGVGEKAAAGLAARGVGPRLAQAGGSALEAGAATAAGDVGHGEAPGWDVATNATVGGALGGLIGGRKIGDEKPPAARSLPDLEADKTAAWNALEATPVKPSAVGDALAQASADLKPGQRAQMSPGLQAQIGQVSNIIDNSPKLTMGDVESFQRSIGAAAMKNNPGDIAAAAKVGEALRALSGQPGADARMAQARLSDAQWLKGADPSKVAGEAAAKLSNPRMLYDPMGRMAMTDLANSEPSKFTEMAQNLGARGINAGLTAAAGGGLGALAGHGLIGAGIGALEGRGPGGIGGILMRQYNNQKAKQAMKAALASVSQPGVYVSPNAYRMPPWTRAAARQAIYGYGASGGGS